MVPGSLALVHHSDNREYSVGVYFLAKIIKETLIFAYFFKRMTIQLTRENYSGVDYEQTRYCQVACFTSIVVNIAKLIEDKKDTWNYEQLFKVWSRYETDGAKKSIVSDSIKELKSHLKWIKQYRHTKIAHQTKDDEISILHFHPNDINFLCDVVAVMDMFVDGAIPYKLYLHESGEELDLRKELNL